MKSGQFVIDLLVVYSSSPVGTRPIIRQIMTLLHQCAKHTYIIYESNTGCRRIIYSREIPEYVRNMSKILYGIGAIIIVRRHIFFYQFLFALNFLNENGSEIT